MAENSPSTSPLDGPHAPGRRLAAVAEPASTTTGAASRRLPSVCAVKVTWMTAPERELSQCVLPRGHRGDHRDERGYPWNEARWAD
jgi:hypothetical protein